MEWKLLSSDSNFLVSRPLSQNEEVGGMLSEAKALESGFKPCFCCMTLRNILGVPGPLFPPFINKAINRLHLLGLREG